MKHFSRKFILAVLCFVLTAVGLIIGRITSGDTVLLVGLILGLYGGANVMQKKVVQENEELYP